MLRCPGILLQHILSDVGITNAEGVSLMIKCQYCGAMNPDSAEKCENCQRQLVSGQTEVIIHETPKLPFIKRAPFRKGT